MAASAFENTSATSTDLKAARKKKTKAGSVANASVPPVTPVETNKEDSAVADAEGSAEHPHLRELQKHIRNVNKKLSSTQKIDDLIAQHPGVSLDELVAQRKINADQKAAALKKPQLQAQLAQYEEQLEHYRKFDAEYQQKLTKQKEELTAAHQKELAKARDEYRVQATSSGVIELRQKILTLSQFLRAAAHRRSLEEEADTDENRAFEGILLLVYGGDQKAVDAAINLIDGSTEHVPSVDGVTLPYSYAQVKQASIDHAPYQAEEAWVDQVAEATGADSLPAAGSDPTLANAGLTELNPSLPANGTFGDGLQDTVTASLNSVGAVGGNTAGERWDTDAVGTVGGAEDGGLDGSYTIIPRPGEEVDIPVAAPAQSTNWADEPMAQDLATSGNAVAEKWDLKTPGDQADNGWNTAPSKRDATKANGWTQASADAASADDGFHEVPGRHRGRGRGRGEGEFRGRGGRRGNFRGRGPRGDFRGRGGRGGPRGGAGNGGSQ